MRIVLCTCPHDKTHIIAKTLLKEKLIACANIIPKIESIYIWKNEICTDNESLLIMKTTKTLINKLINKIKILHPYEIPEIISIKEKEINQEYLNWILEVTSHQT